MTRRAYIYFVLTFVLGAVVGSAGTVIFGWYSGHWRRGPRRAQIVAHLKRELSLTDAQTQQVDQIIKDNMEKFDEVQKQMEPQFAAIRDEGRNRIRQILSPSQLAKFNALVAKWDARLKKHPLH